MKKLTVCSLTAGCLLLSACASQTGWTPTVDTYNIQNSYRLNPDIQECQQLASHASGGTVKETAQIKTYIF